MFPPKVCFAAISGNPQTGATWLQALKCFGRSQLYCEPSFFGSKHWLE
jgi:hypothetical protein